MDMGSQLQAPGTLLPVPSEDETGGSQTRCGRFGGGGGNPLGSPKPSTPSFSCYVSSSIKFLIFHSHRPALFSDILSNIHTGSLSQRKLPFLIVDSLLKGMPKTPTERRTKEAWSFVIPTIHRGTSFHGFSIATSVLGLFTYAIGDGFNMAAGRKEKASKAAIPTIDGTSHLALV